MDDAILDPQETEILDSIESETGYRFPKLGAIPGIDTNIAAQVLPVLRQWVARLDRPNFRGGVYACFVGLAGRPYFGDLLAWLAQETDTINQGILKEVLTPMVTRQNAGLAWPAIRKCINMNMDFKLVIKLANFPATREEAVQALLGHLEDEEKRIAEGGRGRKGVSSATQAICRMREPSIRDWFRRWEASPDPKLRECALRAAGILFTIPKSFRKVRGAVDPTKQVYSTEVDSDDLGSAAQKLEADYGIQVPPEVRSGEIFRVLPETSWLVCQCPGPYDTRFDLWLRREDVSTVEMWLLTT